MRKSKIVLKTGWIGLSILAAALACGCATHEAVSTDVDTGPPVKAGAPVALSPACAPGRVVPGLSITYRFNKYNNIVEIDADAKKSDKPGQPIPNLGHRFGTKPVFDSGQVEGVACFIEGFIRLDRPGTYEFKAFSNDGVRVFIDGKMVLDDPTKHGDRFSDVWKVTAPGAGACSAAGQQPGWHRFKATYFQRKGTAAIELQWKRPGDADFSIVPPEAFGSV